MLSKEELTAEEDELREAVGRLSDESRKAFYKVIKAQLRDPDTHAVLNWFLFAGVHHFYLKRWVHGSIDLGVLFVGVGLLFTEFALAGGFVLLALFVTELFALFRSERIVMTYNNAMYRSVLDEMVRTSGLQARGRPR
jgi:hypothetical protein